jgi:hypothetical protein
MFWNSASFWLQLADVVGIANINMIFQNWRIIQALRRLIAVIEVGLRVFLRIEIDGRHRLLGEFFHKVAAANAPLALRRPPDGRRSD